MGALAIALGGCASYATSERSVADNFDPAEFDHASVVLLRYSADLDDELPPVSEETLEHLVNRDGRSEEPALGGWYHAGLEGLRQGFGGRSVTVLSTNTSPCDGDRSNCFTVSLDGKVFHHLPTWAALQELDRAAPFAISIGQFAYELDSGNYCGDLIGDAAALCRPSTPKVSVTANFLVWDYQRNSPLAGGISQAGIMAGSLRVPGSRGRRLKRLEVAHVDKLGALLLAEIVAQAPFR